MCRLSEALWNCVSTNTFVTPELMQLDSAMSMRRTRPATGTAGLARSRVSGKRRVPWPPPMMMATTSFIGATVYRAPPPAPPDSGDPVRHEHVGLVRDAAVAVAAEGDPRPVPAEHRE